VGSGSPLYLRVSFPRGFAGRRVRDLVRRPRPG